MELFFQRMNNPDVEKLREAIRLIELALEDCRRLLAQAEQAAAMEQARAHPRRQ